MDIRIRICNFNGDLNKRWHVEYYVFDHSKADFKRVRIFSNVNSTLNAQVRLERLLKIYHHWKLKLNNGYELNKEFARVFNPKNHSFVNVMKWVVDEKTPNIRASTIKNWNVTLKNVYEFFEKEYKGIEFVNVNYNHLKALVTFIEAKGIKNKSVNNEIINIKAAYNFLIKQFPELSIINYAVRLEKKQVDKGLKHRPYTKDQLSEIKAKLSTQQLLFVSFIYYCFIRPGELRQLQVGDILDNRIIIKGSIAKNKTNSYVTIPRALNKLIDQHKIRSYPPEYYIFSRNDLPGTTMVGTGYFYNNIRRILDTLGFDRNKYDLYSFKHTGVTHLFESGVDIHDIKMQCRHSEINTTAIYLRNLGLVATNEKILNFPEF